MACVVVDISLYKWIIHKRFNKPWGSAEEIQSSTLSSAENTVLLREN